MATGTTFVDDPNVKIPAAVRAQADRANAIIDQMTSGENDPPKDEAVAPDQQADALLNEPLNPVQQQPAPSEDGDADDRGDENWEHKYKSLYGRMTAMTALNTKLTDQVNNLQAVIASMQTAVPERPASELKFEALTDEEQREYGEDLLKVVGKKAMTEIAPILKELQERIDQQAQTIRTLSGKTAAKEQVSVLETLDEKLPNWRDVNVSPEFVAWLALPDAFSGGIRHTMLKEAFAAGDATRVLAFFNGFLKDEAATSFTATPKPDTGTTRVPKVPLAELAAPGKAKAAATPPAQPEKPIITRAQIASYYADVAAGKYKGREAEKDRLEAMIFSAQQDGRIR